MQTAKCQMTLGTFRAAGPHARRDILDRSGSFSPRILELMQSGTRDEFGMGFLYG